jgi:hypothetical protein
MLMEADVEGLIGAGLSRDSNLGRSHCLT